MEIMEIFEIEGLEKLSNIETLNIEGGDCPWYCEHHVLLALSDAADAFASGFAKGFDSFSLKH